MCFNSNMKVRGLTSLSPHYINCDGSFLPVNSSHICCANGFSNSSDGVSNWCHLACKTWWMPLPIQAEQRTDWGVRGDIWLLASCRLINWSHTKTKGKQDRDLSSWYHQTPSREYLQLHQSTAFFLNQFSPCFITFLLRYLSLCCRDPFTRGHSRYHSPCLSPSLPLSASLFVSFSLPLCLLHSGHQNIFIQEKTKELAMNTLGVRIYVSSEGMRILHLFLWAIIQC